MIRTSTRTRTVLALAAAGLAVPASAIAAPTTPQLLPFPAFVQGTNPSFIYIPGQFDVNSPGVFTVINKRHEVSVRDLTTGSPAVVHTVNYPDVPVVPLALENGHQYAIRVRARQVIDPVFVGPNVAQNSDWTAEEVTRVDDTSPTGTLEVAAGSQFVNTRDVTLTLGGNDPLSAGFTPAGVSHYQASNAAAFPCPGTSCPKPITPAAAHQLADGPDGPRTVRVRYRDGSRHFLGAFDNTPGNESAVISDTVLLDRLAPMANLAAFPAEVLQGTPVSFNASTSVDGAAGANDSGVDPASYQWSYGDGTVGTGVSQSHTYGAAGTYNGTLTIKDRAGNSAVKAFSIKVNAPTPNVAPAGQNTGSPGVTPAEFSLGKIQLIGKARQFRTVRIRVAASAAAGLRGKLTRTVKGRTVVVKRFSKAGGPGGVAMSFKAPKVGIYRLEVSAGDLSRSRSLRVVR